MTVASMTSASTERPHREAMASSCRRCSGAVSISIVSALATSTSAAQLRVHRM